MKVRMTIAHNFFIILKVWQKIPDESHSFNVFSCLNPDYGRTPNKPYACLRKCVSKLFKFTALNTLNTAAYMRK